MSVPLDAFSKYDIPPFALNISPPPPSVLGILTKVTSSDTTWIPPAFISTKLLGSENTKELSSELRTSLPLFEDTVVDDEPSYWANEVMYLVVAFPDELKSVATPAEVDTLTEYLNFAAVDAVLIGTMIVWLDANPNVPLLASTSSS